MRHETETPKLNVREKANGKPRRYFSAEHGTTAKHPQSVLRPNDCRRLITRTTPRKLMLYISCYKSELRANETNGSNGVGAAEYHSHGV